MASSPPSVTPARSARAGAAAMLVSEIAERVHRYDWDAIGGALDADGWARLPRLLRSRECTALRALYTDDARFRSTVDMARHGFGRGEYRYFAHPLPPLVTALRESLYPPLAATARDWARRLHRDPEQFPPTLREFLARCDDAGQRRPTPLLLRYSAGDWNALHQDLYGAVAFPLQVLVVLSPQDEYEGGEVVLVEQRPRAQSRATAITVARGEGIIFSNRERPVRGARGDYRVVMRHGVSVLTAGNRMTLGVIFHDAQ